MTIPTTDFHIFTYSASDGIPTIDLKHDSTWTYCGPLLDLANLPPGLHHWMGAAMDGDIVEQLASFLSQAHQFLAQANMSHYWITIRATMPTHEFDFPRWHSDRPFFDSASGGRVDWKLCTTLVGPGTLFLARGSRARAVQKKTRRAVRKTEAASHECSVVRCLGCAGMQEVVRAKLAEKLAPYPVVQAGHGQFAFFRVGDDKGAVHSEPPIPYDRVFVNVVPGGEDDLRKLTGRWGMEYPRSWTIGVPTCLDPPDHRSMAKVHRDQTTTTIAPEQAEMRDKTRSKEDHTRMPKNHGCQGETSALGIISYF